MKRTALLLAAAALTAPVLVEANPVAANPAADPTTLLTDFLEARMPGDWGLRVRWREDVLVAFLSPPIDEAFDLFYHPDRQIAVLRGLCPPSDAPVWKALEDGQDIALEPVVIGKGSIRASCRNLVKEKQPAS